MPPNIQSIFRTSVKIDAVSPIAFNQNVKMWNWATTSLRFPRSLEQNGTGYQSYWPVKQISDKIVEHASFFSFCFCYNSVKILTSHMPLVLLAIKKTALKDGPLFPKTFLQCLNCWKKNVQAELWQKINIKLVLSTIQVLFLML